MASGSLNSLNLGPDDSYSLRPSDYVLAKSLAAGVAESFTVPDNAKYVLFSATADFYANYTTTATVPGDVTDGTASELNPALRILTSVTTISVIAPADCVITASFWTN
jgi:hypothetical protein